MAKKQTSPKRGASRYQAPAPKSGGVPGWLWLIAGLFLGGFIMFLTKLEPGNEAVKRDTTEPSRTKPAQQTAQPATTTPPSTATTTGKKPKYEFYTLLPESEVLVPPEAVPEKTPPRPTAAELAKADEARARAALSGQTPPPLPKAVEQARTLFYLQAGSFRKPADADRVRAQITLLGQNVKVETGIVRDETWYRVLVGPFSNREHLSKAQQQLSSNGFNNLLLQQRKTR